MSTSTTVALFRLGPSARRMHNLKTGWQCDSLTSACSGDERKILQWHLSTPRPL